jgi:hypothetical protein
MYKIRKNQEEALMYATFQGCINYIIAQENPKFKENKVPSSYCETSLKNYWEYLIDGNKYEITYRPL